MYKNIEISRLIKTAIILFVFSLEPAISYSEDAVAAITSDSTIQQTEAPASEEKKTKSDEFCVVEAFGYVVDWVGKAIRRIENEHFSSRSSEPAGEVVFVPVAPVGEVENELDVVLDLTIPEMKYEGSMAIDKGQKLNFPDMFSEQPKKPYSKEAPSSSFGGRLLMDDAELENMEEYRFNDVREAVRGAEVSLEFKTN